MKKKMNDLRVEKIEQDEDGFWIYLKPGYQVDGLHAIHEDSRKAALALISMIDECTCDDCIGGK